MERTEGRKRKLKSNRFQKKKRRREKEKKIKQNKRPYSPQKAFFNVEIWICLLSVRDFYLFCRICISSEYFGRAKQNKLDISKNSEVAAWPQLSVKKYKHLLIHLFLNSTLFHRVF